jgi:hypothetical protein
MFELNDEVWGIDPVVNKFHHCRGKVVATHTSTNGHPLYIVDFDDIGNCLVTDEQITKHLDGDKYAGA